MNRTFAIVERELRKFFRSPALMLASMVFPLVQLIVLGNAFGGKIRDARMGVVDQDHGTQALRIREAFDSIAANVATFKPIYYDDDKQAQEDVRTGKLDGAVIISAAVLQQVLSAEPSPAGAGGGQLRPVHEQQPGAEDAGAYRCAQPAHGAPAHSPADRAGDRRALSLHRVHEVPAAGLDLPWPCSSR